MSLTGIGEILDFGSKVIERVFPDKTKAAEAQAAFATMVAQGEFAQDIKELDARASIIVAEASSESWLAQSWRPITMLTFVFLIVSYWYGLTAIAVTAEVVQSLMTLLQYGLGGYVVGRSAEKIVKTWKDK